MLNEPLGMIRENYAKGMWILKKKEKTRRWNKTAVVIFIVALRNRLGIMTETTRIGLSSQMCEISEVPLHVQGSFLNFFIKLQKLRKIQVSLKTIKDISPKLR